MRSMTGFGQGAATGERHQVAVTLRSVNGRHLDLTIRLKDEYRALEAPLRGLLESELRRGRVEAAVDIRSLQLPAARVVVQTEVVRALQAASRQLAAEGLVTPELAIADLLRVPEALVVEVAPDSLGGDEEELVLRTAAGALAQLVAAREQEGATLRRVLGERLAELSEAAADLRARAPEVRADLHGALKRRLAELLEGVGTDEARVAQEAALLVDRSDVTEELDRLTGHLGHFAELLAAGGALGKRLDFLGQEILRELNTLGAKCRDGAMTRIVLDAKVLCEQLREQVQNVE
jgi:uncharacterized protein (TIGR00255 family)